MKRREILLGGLAAAVSFPNAANAWGMNNATSKQATVERRADLGEKLRAVVSTGFRRREQARSVRIANLHNGEVVESVYWQKGRYNAEELRKLKHFFRDWRDGSTHDMDPRLYDIIYQVHARLDVETMHLISGYRSPKTNAMLHRTSDGVATNSLHLHGLAADIRAPGHTTEDLQRVAMKIRAGGVGFYPKSNFVHVDTGDVRYW